MRSRVFKGLLVLVLLLGIAVMLANREALNVEQIQLWLDGMGLWAAPAYVLVYAIGTVLFFPGSVLTMTGGAVFGPWMGTGLSLIGALIGSTSAFLIARSTGGEWVSARVGGRLGELVEGVDREGWRFVAFMRLVPILPYNLLNYALGLTKIRLVEVVLATAICIVPGTAAFSYLGHAGREAASGSGSAIRAGLVGLALLAAAVFVIPKLVVRLRG